MQTNPKILFKPITLEENIKIIQNFYFEEDKKSDFHNLLCEYFPELHDIHKNFSKEEISTKISAIITNYYTSNSQNIKEACKKYSDIWSKYNNIYFIDLVDLIE